MGYLKKNVFLDRTGLFFRNIVFLDWVALFSSFRFSGYCISEDLRKMAVHGKGGDIQWDIHAGELLICRSKNQLAKGLVCNVFRSHGRNNGILGKNVHHEPGWTFATFLETWPLSFGTPQHDE